jgi:replicative DNA helicase
LATSQRFDKPRTEVPKVEALLGKQPPVSIEAEIGVIGSVILAPDVLDEVAMIVRAEDFHDLAHEKLYRHLLAMHESGRKADLTLLHDRLKTAGELEAVGGMAYIHQIFEAVTNAAHANYYAEIVREKSILRSLINASTAILRESYEEGMDSKHLLSTAEQRIMGILDSRSSSMPSTIRGILQEAMERISARMEGHHASDGVETGLVDLDKLTGGLHGSELIVLAGRPSMGKTALAMNIAEAVAIHQRVATLFVSLEMSKIELADRMLCSIAKVNGHRLRNGTISNEELNRLVEKASEISEAPLYVDDSPSRTVTEIAAAARRIERRERDPNNPQKRGLGLIVIDYLQLIEPDNPKDPRQEQVAKITRRLKGLAREMNVPLLVLAQLNRQAEVSKDNKPRLSHLRESGAIEQDADVVMFVHREEYYRHGEEKKDLEGQAEIILAKQRNGPVDDVKVRWMKDFTRFVNAAPDNMNPDFEAFNQTGEVNF